jgi:ribonuclease E
MSKKILIDARHLEETRTVTISQDNKIEDFDIESVSKKELKGNIYLAKVVRVEPSLQAAFVEYGGNRHGFLPFSEIHPSYYQIPVADQKKLLATNNKKGNGDEDFDEDVDEDIEANTSKRKELPFKKYKIQEVIKSRQIMLIQVVKEERGNKGASLTTYISLAGRFCVLMPNNARDRKYGVSRKISNYEDRKRIKSILKEMNVPDGMTVIVRTAGADKTKKEIEQDYQYLRTTWDEIRKKTMKAVAPSLIHEEANLILRVIRDMYKGDVSEIIVEGKEGYEQAKNYLKTLGGNTRNIKQHSGKTSLFQEYNVESQLENIHYPEVTLKSGGYLVINPTEALIAIDVNSGKSTKERNIEETALRNNLEAAEEVARQIKIRDLAGLIVVDFIDMEDKRNNEEVEKKLREALRRDRAKVQMGKISEFGLMEMSRQRLRPNIIETNYKECPHCKGLGVVPSIQTTAILMLRHMENEILKKKSKRFLMNVPSDVALYMLNQKRDDIKELETKYKTEIIINGDDTLLNFSNYSIERLSHNQSTGEFLREKEAPNTKTHKSGSKKANKDLLRKTPRRTKDIQSNEQKDQNKGILSKIFQSK